MCGDRYESVSKFYSRFPILEENILSELPTTTTARDDRAPVGGRDAVIALLTDFGTGDGDVGVMKGVMLGIAAGAQIIDITHEVAPQHIHGGAWILAASYRYFPRGTVFTCVVDPGVGSQRYPIAVQAGEWFFVGPDNGLFSFVLAEQPVHEAVQASNPAYHLPVVSSTFHGRDIFAPVAAHIARGLPLAELGPPIASERLQRIDLALAGREDARIEGRIIHVDNFGNLITNIRLSMIPDLFSCSGIQATFPQRNVTISGRRRFFAEESEYESDGSASGEGVRRVGEDKDPSPFVYPDSSGYLAIAVRNGSAAKMLQIGYNAPLVLLLATEQSGGVKEASQERG